MKIRAFFLAEVFRIINTLHEKVRFNILVPLINAYAPKRRWEDSVEKAVSFFDP